MAVAELLEGAARGEASFGRRESCSSRYLPGLWKRNEADILCISLPQHGFNKVCMKIRKSRSLKTRNLENPETRKLENLEVWEPGCRGKLKYLYNQCRRYRRGILQLWSLNCLLSTTSAFGLSLNKLG